MSEPIANRPLSEQERRLALWMLENGIPKAASFIPQLERAEATSWRCPCGCASFNFKVADEAEAPPGVNILGDFIVGERQGSFGVFIFESKGILRALRCTVLLKMRRKHFRR
jgi:hypothetical protein